jgi:O-antigen/teichoic acid export membrane protein
MSDFEDPLSHIANPLEETVSDAPSAVGASVGATVAAPLGQTPLARGALSKIVVRNSVFTLLDQGVAITVMIATAGIVARKLGPHTMGYYGFAMWIVLSSSQLGLGVVATIKKFAAEYMGRGDIAMVKAITRAGFWAQGTSAFVFAIIACGYVFGRIPEGHRLYNMLALLTVIPLMLQGVPTVVNMASEDFLSNVIPSMLCTVLQPLGVIFAVVFQWHLAGLALGLLVARSADMALRLYLFRNRFPADIPRIAIPPELKSRMWRFFWSSIVLVVLDLIVWERCEVFFLERFSSITQVAFYNSSFQLATILMTLPTAFAWSAAASLMVQKGRDPKAMNRITAVTLRYMAMLVFPLTLGMAALASPAIRLLFGVRYEPAIPVMALMAIMTIPKGLLSPAQQLLIAHEKQKFLVGWEVVAATVTITLDYYLIRRHGAIGGVWGNGIAQLIAVLGIWIFAIWQERLVLPWSALLRMLLSAGAMAAVARLCAVNLPPLQAALIGVPLGAAVYALLLKVTRSFQPEDLTRLNSLGSRLPASLRPWYSRGLQWMMA